MILTGLGLSTKDFLFLLGSFVAGGLGAFLIGRYACQLGLLDVPNARSSHTLTTPKGGGVGIVAAFLIGATVYGISPFLWGPVIFLAVISFWGDRVHISPSLRLVCQFLASFVVLYGMVGHLPSLLGELFSRREYVLVFAPLAAIFVVGTTNFYNFMDGINGMAAITGIIGFGLLFAYGVYTGKDMALLMVCLGLSTACSGFLPFNIPSARVFMGDVGSILLGFVFGVMVIAFAGSMPEFCLLSSFIFPFYADELVTMAERLRDGQRLTRPHRRHMYQILANEAGIAHWKVSVMYGIFQLFVGISLWKAANLDKLLFWAVLGCLIVFFMLINSKVKRKYPVREGVI